MSMGETKRQAKEFGRLAGRAVFGMSTLILLAPSAVFPQRNARLAQDDAVVYNVHVTAPANAADFDVAEANHTSTPQVAFTGEIRPARVGGNIDWRPALEYATSGNRGATNLTRAFQTTSGQTSNQVYASEGGRITVNATATIGQARAVVAQPPRFTVTGVQIPDAEITDRLVALYAGATPRILTGISTVESTYRQFGTSTLYGRADRWPLESFDGGSHIGLMQVAVSLAPAWNWLTNTQGGADVFNEGLRVSGVRETTERNAHPTLPALTGAQHEDNALCFYRLGTAATNRYWVPAADFQSWVVTTTNATCVNYRNDVRAGIQ